MTTKSYFFIFQPKAPYSNIMFLWGQKKFFQGPEEGIANGIIEL